MSDTVVVITEGSLDIVEVISSGPQGAQGPIGPQGNVGDVNPEMYTLRDQAAASATNAAASAATASSAQTGAQTAQTAAETAQTGAQTAQTAAAASAATATTQASNASSSASTATTQASNASTSATTATTKAAEAVTSASNASTSATTATTQAGIATTKAAEAVTSASNAATSATNAASSASSASTSATTATTKANDASSFATNAANSASTATTQATSATSSATAAATSASNASSHASQAGTQAVAAAASAATATTQAGIATTQASNSATSAATATTQAGLASGYAATSTAKASEAAGSAAAINATFGNAASVALQAQNAQAAASLAQGYAASASSVVQQDLSGITVQALHRSPNAITAQFIYDTSKDSDGGAWTEKCQGTSWYNEALAGKWLGPQFTETFARYSGATVSTTELITNGTFSSGVSGWTASTYGASTLSANNNVLRVTETGAHANATAGQTFPVTSGKVYRVTFDVVSNTSSAGIGCWIGSGYGAANWLYSNVTYGYSFPGRSTFYFTAAGATAYFELIGYFTAGGTSEYFEVANVSVREVTALNTASNDYFQLTTDGKFYRLWKNLLSNSDALTSFSVTPTTGLTSSLNAGTAPNGASIARLLTNTTTTEQHRLYVGATLVSGSTYTYSVYARRDTADWMQLSFNLGSSTTAFGNFNLATGAKGTEGGTGAATITPVGGGWYRCTLTATTGGINCNVQLYVLEADSVFANPGTTGTGKGIFVYGAQLELGTIATSYEAKAAEGTTSEIFRGNKADFPRLAAIVAEAANVTIYDLTEPGRPMWMRFTGAGANIGLVRWIGGAVTVSGISMLNGSMVVASNSSFLADFQSDRSACIYNTGFSLPAIQNLSQRNAPTTLVATGGIIVANATVNAVAMTVLPDAPIDPATGLRVPTIAVATGGGVSVIKHNGTVVSTASANSFHHVYIDRNILMYSRTGDRWVAYALNPGSLGASFAQILMGTNPDEYQSANPVIERFSGRSAPIRFISPAVKRKWNNEALPTRGLNMSVAPTYNTGWMTGDIRRAYLSDVTAEAVAANIQNEDFSSYADNAALRSVWSSGTPADISLVGGKMQIAVASTWVARSWPTVIGRVYRISVTVASGVSPTIRLGSNVSGTQYGQFTATPVGTVRSSFLATGTNFWASAYASPTLAHEFSSFVLEEVVADRSYKAAIATINGTLTKAQLATGTSLVGYSGFSASNYLREPYSADLDFGTGEFTATAWVNIPVTIAPATRALGPELLADPSFDTPASWSLNAGASITGSQLIFSSVGSTLGAYSVANISSAGRVYAVTFVVSAVTAGQFRVRMASGALVLIPASAGTYTIYCTSDTGASGPFSLLATGTTSGVIDSVTVKEVANCFIFDRAFSSGPRLQLLATPAGYLSAVAFDGTTTRTVTTTAAYNTATWLKARVRYTTDGSLAILVNGREVAVTRGAPLGNMTLGKNLLLQSEAFDNAAWTKVGVTVPSTTEVAPDATTTADRIVAANNASASRFAYQSATVTSGGTFTYSVYAKAAGYTNVALMEIGAGRFGATFDLVAVTSASLGGAGYVSSSITAAGSGWYRCSVTFTSAASSYAFAVVGYPTGTSVGSAGLSYAGNGVDGIVVWGAQVETGSTLTSYAATNVAVLTIGNNFALDAPFPGSIALLKLGATVPTPEQATFMYEQEKQLFRANALSVLPDAGSVVDMAYDDATDRWVAVSAANESYWTGLVRNTVTPVPAGSYTRVVATSGIELAARSTTNPGVDVTIPAYGLREELVKRSEAAARLSKELATFDYVGGFTANTTNGNTAITSASTITYPGSYIGARISGSGIPTNATIVAVSGTTLYISAAATATATTVQITFLDFALPAGMEAKTVFNAGAQAREGASAAFTRLYDGFIETIRFGAAPGYTALVTIQAQRISQ